MALRFSIRTHTAKDGTVTRYARFRQPERSETSEIMFRPVERSIGSLSRREGAKLIDEWYREAQERANRPFEQEKPLTFAEVALTYMRTKGRTPFMAPILEQIGERPVREITQQTMTDLAASLYPGRTAATINRQLFTPVIAALRLSSDESTYAMPKLTRPKGHDSLPDLDVPNLDWYKAVIPVANPWLRAFLIIGWLHGPRPGELLSRTKEHFNAETGTLLIHATKTGKKHVLELAEPALRALLAIPDLDSARRIRQGSAGKHAPRLSSGKRGSLFGTHTKFTMRKWLIKACEEAKVRYHMPKEAGRHAFATHNLEDGKSLAWLKSAGRWDTLRIPCEKYGHLEKDGVALQARQSGEDRFLQSVGKLQPHAPLLIESGEGFERNRPQSNGNGDGDALAP